ncbi:hypothetical protein AYO21_05725 [Fonsecaea monophora]|uniref:L-tryptophan decarboxylase PsiD-like domain-containing protein n=1 Tax=Fonsecaea monophora TaxID=254056 RepID=A0A177F751_9EURO|nr:hypothetical protein AYO21_05725 [Fonsecaea monophora]OAG40044.1 hypothetical protein AYO21_05725 [Fonsecaea monophora]
MAVGFRSPHSRGATSKETELVHHQPSIAPAFPLSSPQQEPLTTFKPINGGMTLAPTETFFSPNPFASSSSDDDTGSSSGQDEFHLERYSRETTRNGQVSEPKRKQSSRRKHQQKLVGPRTDKKTRPGLNIVTNFPAQAKRAQTDGLVIEQVQSQRPRLGPRYTTSVLSAKAEHVSHLVPDSIPNHNMKGPLNHNGEVLKRTIARQAVSKLQESQAARKAGEEFRVIGKMDTGGQAHGIVKEEELREPTNALSDYSPEARSIVIGISVPEHELDAHRSAGGVSNPYSAITPDTPAIVVTPAEETDSWKPPFFGKGRPISSTYSPYTRSETQIRDSELPPVPKIPLRHAHCDNQVQPTIGASIAQSTRGASQKDAEDYDSDGGSHQSLEEISRMSSDSQEQILPSDIESRRRKSQGWWNLMLSPMLSRKGTTTEKPKSKSPATPPVPSLPADIRLSRSDIVSPLTSESPETPRRLGLASARASIWSRWTTWEKQRDGSLHSPPANLPHPDVDQSPHLVQDVNPGTAWAVVDFTKGLAAEYYHACAVEQLTGVPYFECDNHSCASRLPKLHSIFDKGVVAEPAQDVSNSRRVDADLEETADAPANEERVLSRGVSIRSEPEELSPNVRQAETAAVVKAKSVESPDVKQVESQQKEAASPLLPAVDTSQAPRQSVTSTEQTRREAHYPSIAAVAAQPPILSPGPVSPAMQHTMTSQGAVPMTQVDYQPSQPRSLEQTTPSDRPQAPAPTQPPSVTIHNHTFYSERFASGDDNTVRETRRDAMERLESTTSTQEVSQKQEVTRQQMPVSHESETVKKAGVMTRLKGLLRRKKAGNKDDADKKKKRRWTLIIGIILFIIVLACVLLATFLTRTGDSTPVQSQWLNLTGYPPIPTGISTIARPDVVKQQSQCVGPNTMWSCALPKEEQFEVAPNSPDQPNFRFEINFRNGTVPANMTVPIQELRKRSERRLRKRADDPFTNDLFDPNPTPPSRADQIFMGNTTDNITKPFEGEQTPFYITFVPVFPIDPSNTTATASSPTGSKLRRRQSTNSSDAIPAPDVLSDGSAAPANLLPNDPYPSSQPIKLYNRGQADEHYGFYIYYDKAIFLHSTAALNTSEFTDNNGIDPEDENGGSTRDQSRLRCTFSQTRFLVRMWTNPAFGATLLPAASNGTNSTDGGSSNSATDFSRPGSFPYPTTISIDRHGGNINKKAVYCYGVDQLQVIQSDIKTIVPEFRSVSGTLINAAPGLVNGTISDDTGFDQEAGGIDGGTGGLGDWLPDHDVHREWLSGVIQKVDQNPKDLHPVLVEFKELIENNTRVYMLFESMFEQVPKKEPYNNDPRGEGHPQVRDYIHMLRVINHMLTTPPSWSESSARTGLVGLPFNALFDWPMGTASGYAVFLDPDVNKMLKKVLNAWGDFLRSPESAKVLEKDAQGSWFGPHGQKELTTTANLGKTGYKFEELFQCDPSKPHMGYKSWDDFFTRLFKEEARPVASPEDDNVIANACESKTFKVARDVKARDHFWLKGQPYSVIDMLAQDPWADKFVGGTVYQAFLSALSYHRWHAPVSGKLVKAYVVDGTYYSEPLFEDFKPDHPADPEGQVTSQGYLTATATRAIMFFEADNPALGLMAFLGIGMCEVSTCEITVKEGQHVKKGDEIGMFHFGGSTHCLMFRKGVRVEGFPEPHPEHNIPVRSELARVKV